YCGPPLPILGDIQSQIMNPVLTGYIAQCQSVAIVDIEKRSTVDRSFAINTQTFTLAPACGNPGLCRQLVGTLQCAIAWKGCPPAAILTRSIADPDSTNAPVTFNPW